MSSFHRQHHGRSRPPPTRNQSGFHPPSAEAPQSVDPHYLADLCSQVAELHQQISEPHKDSPQDHSLMLINSINHLQCLFYHQRTIINQNRQDVYSSWNQAHSYCWDPSTQYFFQGVSVNVLIHLNLLGSFFWMFLKTRTSLYYDGIFHSCRTS